MKVNKTPDCLIIYPLVVFTLSLFLTISVRAGDRPLLAPIGPSKAVNRSLNVNKPGYLTPQHFGGREVNTDRPGSGYRSFLIPRGGVKVCRTQCDKEPRCKAYTYVKPSARGVQARCWLKSTAPPPTTPNVCCISGIKKTSPGASTVRIPPGVPGDLGHIPVHPPPGPVDTRSTGPGVEDSWAADTEDGDPWASDGGAEDPWTTETDDGGYGVTDGEGSEYWAPNAAGGQGGGEEWRDELYPPPQSEERFPGDDNSILERGVQIGESQNSTLQEGTYQGEGGYQGQGAEEKPYAEGVLSNLATGNPELLITNISMRKPSKKELVLSRNLKPHDLVFEVKVVNTSKTPVSMVGVLVAIGDGRYETVINKTIEYRRGANAVVYVRPVKKMFSKGAIEVNAIVDPNDEYRENNEDNNLFTRIFKVKP